MSLPPICAECAGTIPAGSAENLCPRCLIATVLGQSADGQGHEEAEIPPGVRAPGQPARFGDYELIEEIARGGMGVVYRARQVSLDRTVAVKVLLFGRFSSNEFVRRFRAEAAAAASLHHPNIVPIHEVGEHEGQPYFSMDFIEGQNLADLAHDRPIPAGQAARLLETIARAVQYAHERGVLHRDLKLSNVLIGQDNHPFVTDFGLAKRLQQDGTMTGTGEVLGSPNTMSPEQAFPSRGEPGPTSDVYSLGAILYQLLTGRPPFLAETVEETMHLLVHSEPVPPRTLNPVVPHDLENITLKCLQKEPTRRYASAAALADDLLRFLQSRPVLARPTNPLGKIARWCRREPVLAGLSALLLLVFAAGFTGVLWQWRRAEQKSELLRHSRYTQGLNQAFAAFFAGNRSDALRSLQDLRPRPGETDERGFEWRHLWRLCTRGGFNSLPEKNQVLGAMAYSPDGGALAAYYWDDTLRLWDPRTQRLLFEVKDALSLGGFSADGRVFAASVKGGKTNWYRVPTGEVLRTTTGVGELVAVAANCRVAVALTPQATLQVLDLADGKVRREISGAFSRRSDYGWNARLGIAPDGSSLACGDRDGNRPSDRKGIQIWNLQDGTPRAFLDHAAELRCLAYSPDGKTLACGSGDGSVTLWNVATGLVDRAWRAHARPVLSLVYSADGATIATGSSDESISLWDAQTGLARAKTFPNPVGDVWSLAFSPDGRHLASGSRDSEARLWSLAGPETTDSVSGALASERGNVTFSRDGRQIAGGSADGAVRVWEVETLRQRNALPDARSVLGFSNDGKKLLTLTDDGVAQWWDLGTNAKERTIRCAGDMSTVKAVDFSQGKQLTALGYADGMIRLVEMQSGTTVASWQAHHQAILSVAFSPDESKLVSGGSDRVLTVWDWQTQRRLASKEGSHRGAIWSVAFSRDGTLVASGCGSDMVKLWHASDLQSAVTPMPYHKSAIRALAFSPDRNTLASGSEDATVKLLSVRDHSEMATLPQDSTVRQVLFSPDGNTLAVVTEKGTLSLLRTLSLAEADRTIRGGAE